MDGDLSANLNENATFADGDVDHGTGHAWTNVVATHLERG